MVDFIYAKRMELENRMLIMLDFFKQCQIYSLLLNLCSVVLVVIKAFCKQ